jgi:hypothetical protein
MTVCIAARSNDGAVICAADRMVTVGDMEMESPVPKIVMLTRSIALMSSDDDAAFHNEIIVSVYETVSARAHTTPDKWWTIKEVVDLYVETLVARKNARAERDILRPLGLDHLTYNMQQSTLDPDLVKQIAVDLVNYKIPYLSAIITGVDPSGSHIRVIHTATNGNIETGSHTSIGYAAIGAGARHANAELLTAEQSWKTDLPKTLWNTYLAKKRAQVAPGVGETTDVYMIGPGLGFSLDLNDDVKNKLEAVYKETRKREEQARHDAAEDMTSYVKKLAESAQQPQVQTAPTALAPGGESAQPQGPPEEGSKSTPS